MHHHTRSLAMGLLLTAASACSDDETRLLIDGGHGNFHTANGRYEAFAELVQDELGSVDRPVRVRGTRRALVESTLDDVDVLVVATVRPKHAPSDDELDAIEAWVDEGGALLLVTEHDPYTGLADLAARFGFVIPDGRTVRRDGRIHLEREAGTIHDHPVTNGPFGTLEDLTVGGTGAFEIPEGAAEAVGFSRGDELALRRGGRVPANHMSLIATRHVGAGRVAVVGEASMLSCRIRGETPIGWCEEGREDQRALTLNLVHWLVTGEE